MDCQTIFIVLNSGLLEVFIHNLLGVVEFPRGNLTNAKNCWDSLIELNQNTYRMLCAPNTKHLSNIKDNDQIFVLLYQILTLSNNIKYVYTLIKSL